jgi:hypothetical protein
MSKVTKAATKVAKTATKAATKTVATTANVLLPLNDVNFQSINLAKSGRSVKLIYDKQTLNITTPTLYMPFNLNKYQKQWSNFEDYSVDCYVDTYGENETQDTIGKLNALNECIFETVKSNLNLFNVPNNEEISFSPFYKDNKSFPKLLKLNFPRDTNGNFITQFFDENSNKIFVDETNIDTILTKKTSFKTIIGCSKVYVYQNKAGCSWDILQLKLNPVKKANNTNNYNINDTDSVEMSDDSDNSSNGGGNNKIYTQMSMIDD